MVCSLTLCFLAASATEVRSHSRRIATICSSVNRLLRIGSSLAKEPFFQKLTDRKTSSGHGNALDRHRRSRRPWLFFPDVAARRCRDRSAGGVRFSLLLKESNNAFADPDS